MMQMKIKKFKKNMKKFGKVLHPHLNDFINYYRDGDIISLPLYHGCNHLNRNRTRKEIDYNLGYQCNVPTEKRYWRETKDKYRRKINDNFY